MPAMGLRPDDALPVARVTVITTVFNEGLAALDMLDSVLTGDVVPTEIVIADGGSTDGTVELLQQYAAAHPEVRLLTEAGGRSEGRNAAIAAASHDHIVSIDGGCVAEPAWLGKISEPLLAGESWVAGFYRPEGATSLSTAIGLTMVFVEDEVVFPDFTPSARSMAFHRDLWKEVGGFPESEQFAEDTAFGEALAAAGHQAVFVPEAVVEWRPPSSLMSQARTLFSWGRGDGHLGMRSINYRHLFPRFLGAGVLALTAIAFPLLLLIAPLPLAPMVYRKSRSKYRHMEGWAKWLLIPMATVNGLAFSLAGYMVGYAERRSGRWTPAGLPAPSIDGPQTQTL
jgi:cellulose synthase/poly-beta-1,6-N-acetylglucosamine synthase-like glycosyltransferase